ncbi:MAG: inositol monophosphatase [Nitrospirae bacterium]|nr:inositol monophosphatase [Nitrospirota bacterium]
MKTFLKTAEEAALAGGRVLMEYYGKPLDVEFKGDANLVTIADRLSEDAIVSIITENYPGHRIMAEEGTTNNNISEYCWIIDPLDGTTNFAHSLPIFAVSIGLEKNGNMVMGVVYDPLRDECFTAMEGCGAYLNGKPIHVSRVDTLDKSLLATGFPYDRRINPDGYIKHFREFLKTAQEIRRPGAATIDLCYVASGRFDGFWEPKLQPWDIAAAAVIVKEAGGRLSNYIGGEFSIYGKETVASNGKIHEEMIEVLKGIL